MKRSLYFLILIVTSIGFSQDLSMQDGTFNRCDPDKIFYSGGEFGNYGNDDSFKTYMTPKRR